jgi:uncharacterized protein YidB (DUF937 family)
MGLLDGVLGQVLGGLQDGGRTQGGQNPLLQVLMQLMQQSGGLPGLLDQFRRAGYAREADSWVGTGQNLPIDAEILGRVLGSGGLGQILGNAGMGSEQAAGGLAELLPQVVDRMTPEGRVPEDHDAMLEQGLAALSRMTRLGA